LPVFTAYIEAVAPRAAGVCLTRLRAAHFFVAAAAFFREILHPYGL
jgi:hypothetical protein